MAKDINNATATGRLTRDMEISYTSAGTAIGKFSIANNYRMKKGDEWTDEVNYFDVVLWGKKAESLEPYLKKGKQVAIQGEMRQSRWEKDGVKRSKIEIIANEVFLSGASDGVNRGSQAEKKADYHDSDIPF